MRRLICLVTVCFIIATILPGCGVLRKLGLLKNDNDESRPASSIVMGEDEARKLTDKVPVQLYFANEDNTKLRLEIRYIPMSEAKKSTGNLASIIVKELINGPGPNSRLKPTIPAGTQLRAPVEVNAGVATVDFTKDFIDKHPGGKAAEQITIFSIVNSLTELKDIQKVKFLINGKPSKEFKGNFQFDAPFPRSPSIISREPVPSSTGAGDAAETGIQNPEGGESGETSGEPVGDSEETYLELEDLDETFLEIEEEEILE
jgi:germination protein M